MSISFDCDSPNFFRPSEEDRELQGSQFQRYVTSALRMEPTPTYDPDSLVFNNEPHYPPNQSFELQEMPHTQNPENFANNSNLSNTCGPNVNKRLKTEKTGKVQQRNCISDDFERFENDINDGFERFENDINDGFGRFENDINDGFMSKAQKWSPTKARLSERQSIDLHIIGSITSTLDWLKPQIKDLQKQSKYNCESGRPEDSDFKNLLN